MSGTLYVVATPIGNLEDMTYRAVRVLQEVALIAAEDTRHSRKLLDHYLIKTGLISCHEHNEQSRTAQLLQRLQQGDSIALISDAGTPCIADPGYRLVSACREVGINVVAVPGASAVIAALSIAGQPTDSFCFLGFIPAKAQARQQFLEQLQDEKKTSVCYEAPHRLLNCLQDICTRCGEDRPLAVARELTKRHEELFSGSASAALEHFSAAPVKGEIVLLIGPAVERGPVGTPREAMLELHQTSALSWKQISKQVAKQYGLPGSDVYREMLALRQQLEEQEGQ